METPAPTRRKFLQATAAGTGLAVTGTTANRFGLQPPVEKSKAHPAVVAAGGIALGMGLYHIYDYTTKSSHETQLDILNHDLEKSLIQYMEGYENLVGLNENVAELGKDAIFSDAKIAAIEKLNEQETHEVVEQAAIDAAKEKYITLEENLWEHYIGIQNTILSYWQQAKDQGFEPYQVVSWENDFDDEWSTLEEFSLDGKSTQTSQIANKEYDVQIFYWWVTDGDWTRDTTDHFFNFEFSEFPAIEYSEHGRKFWPTIEGEPLFPNDYVDRYDEIADKWDDGDGSGMKNEIITWVGEAYDAVAAGEIEIEELLSATDMAELVAEEHETELATAHLRMANIPNASGVKSTVEVPLEHGTATARNVMLATTDDDATLKTGEEIDPGDEPGDYIFNFYPADTEILIDDTEYDIQLDGGVFTLTNVPRMDHPDGTMTVERYVTDDYLFSVETIEGETATFTYSALSYDDTENEWTIDLSDQLEVQITEVDELRLFVHESDRAESAVSHFQKTPFTITSAVKLNEEGEEEEELEELTFERDREPHTADNYLTQDEWDDYLDQQKKLLDELEEQDDSELFISDDDWWPFPTLPGVGAAGTIIAFVLGLFGLGQLKG